MPDSFEEQGWVRIGVATALAKEYAADQKHFLKLLAETLDHALPGEAETKTKGFFSSKSIVGVSVALGDLRYSIDDPGRGPLMATRTKIVRGIALKTEEISVPECVEEISDALEARAGKTAEARNALASLLGLE